MSQQFYETQIKQLTSQLQKIKEQGLPYSIELMVTIKQAFSGEQDNTKLIQRIQKQWPTDRKVLTSDPFGVHQDIRFKPFITSIVGYLRKDTAMNEADRDTIKKEFKKYYHKVREKELQVDGLRAQRAKTYCQLAEVSGSQQYYQKAAQLGYVPAKKKLKQDKSPAVQQIAELVDLRGKISSMFSILLYAPVVEQLHDCLEHIDVYVQKITGLTNSSCNINLLSSKDDLKTTLENNFDAYQPKLIELLISLLEQLDVQIKQYFNEASCKTDDGDFCYYYADYLASIISRELQMIMTLYDNEDQKIYDKYNKQRQNTLNKALRYYQKAAQMEQNNALVKLAGIKQDKNEKKAEVIIKESSDKKKKKKSKTKVEGLSDEEKKQEENEKSFADGNQLIATALDDNYGPAYAYKARQYQLGRGEEKDIPLARFYHQQAMLLGDKQGLLVESDAKDALKRLGMPKFADDTPPVEKLAQAIFYKMAGGDVSGLPLDEWGNQFDCIIKESMLRLKLKKVIDLNDLTKDNMKKVVDAGSIGHREGLLNFHFSHAIELKYLSTVMLLLYIGAKEVSALVLKTHDLTQHENIPWRPEFRRMMRLLTRHLCQYENYRLQGNENEANAHYFSVFSILFAEPKSFTYFLKQVDKTSRQKASRFSKAENRIIKQADEKEDINLFENLLTYLDSCEKIDETFASDNLSHCLLHDMSHWINHIKTQLDKPALLIRDEKWSRAVKGGTALGDLLRHLYYLALTKPQQAKTAQPIDYDGLKKSLENIGIDEVAMHSQPSLRRKTSVPEMAKLFVNPSDKSIKKLFGTLNNNNKNRVLMDLLIYSPNELLDEVLETSETKAESLLLFMHVIYMHVINPCLLNGLSSKDIWHKLNTCLQYKKYNSLFSANAEDSILSVWEKLTSNNKRYSDTEDNIYRPLLSEALRYPQYFSSNRQASSVDILGMRILREPKQSKKTLAHKADQLDETYQAIAKLTSALKTGDELYINDLVFKSGVNYNRLLQEPGMSVRTLLLRIYVFDKNYYYYKNQYTKKLEKGRITATLKIPLEKYQLEQLMKNLVDGKDEKGHPLKIDKRKYTSIAHAMFAEILTMIEEGVNPEMIEDLLYLICAGERWNYEHKKKFVERPLLSSFFRMPDSNPKNKKLRYWLKTWITRDEYHKGKELKFMLPQKNIAKQNVKVSILHTKGFISTNKTAINLNKDAAITLTASLYELTQLCRDEDGKQTWYKDENAVKTTKKKFSPGKETPEFLSKPVQLIEKSDETITTISTVTTPMVTSATVPITTSTTNSPHELHEGLFTLLTCLARYYKIESKDLGKRLKTILSNEDQKQFLLNYLKNSPEELSYAKGMENAFNNKSQKKPSTMNDFERIMKIQLIDIDNDNTLLDKVATMSDDYVVKELTSDVPFNDDLALGCSKKDFIQLIDHAVKATENELSSEKKESKSRRKSDTDTRRKKTTAIKTNKSSSQKNKEPVQQDTLFMNFVLSAATAVGFTEEQVADYTGAKHERTEKEEIKVDTSKTPARIIGPDCAYDPRIFGGPTLDIKVVEEEEITYKCENDQNHKCKKGKEHNMVVQKVRYIKDKIEDKDDGIIDGKVEETTYKLPEHITAVSQEDLDEDSLYYQLNKL